MSKTENRFSIKEQMVREGTLHNNLAQWVAFHSDVINAETGYIVCKAINHRVNPAVLRASVQIVQDEFLSTLSSYQQPTAVLGVSNRGKEFAGAASLLLNLDNCVTDRVKDEKPNGGPDSVYYDEKQDTVVIPGIPSFTKGGTYTHTIRGLKPASTVAVFDDFCAYGHSSRIIHKAFEKLGIRSHHLFLVAKDFPNLNPPQIGYRQLKEQKVSAFCVVRFTGMENGNVIATHEDIKL